MPESLGTGASVMTGADGVDTGSLGMGATIPESLGIGVVMGNEGVEGVVSTGAKEPLSPDSTGTRIEADSTGVVIGTDTIGVNAGIDTRIELEGSSPCTGAARKSLLT